MDESRCGHPTRAGGACRWPRNECPHHRNRKAVPAQTAPEPADRETEPVQRPRERDLRELGWWLVDQVLAGRVGREQATGVASVMRVLAGLGPDAGDTDAALAEVELRGRIAYGLPPRDTDEWALARERFTEEALQELARRSEESPCRGGGEMPADIEGEK